MKAVREHLDVEVVATRQLDVREFRGPLHTHPQWEITLIDQGAGVRLVGDHIGTFSAGELVLLGPGLPHTWTSAVDAGDRACAHVVHFGPAVATVIDALPDDAPLRSLLRRAERGLLFGRLSEQLTSTMQAVLGAPSSSPDLAGLFLVLQELSLMPAAELSRAAAGPIDALARRRVDAVNAYIDDNLAGQIEMVTAARHAALTPAAFSRFFKHATGRTFTDYVTEIRLSTACALLRETDLPVTEVASRAGFGNLANFNRRFRQHRATTPTAYRRAA